MEVLADLYNRRRGYAWPSQKTGLPQRMHVSERHVRRAVAELRAAGWICTDRVFNGPLRYRLACPAGQVGEGQRPAAAGPSGQLDTPHPDGEVRLPPKKNPSINHLPHGDLGGQGSPDGGLWVTSNRPLSPDEQAVAQPLLDELYHRLAGHDRGQADRFWEQLGELTMRHRMFRQLMRVADQHPQLWPGLVDHLSEGGYPNVRNIAAAAYKRLFDNPAWTHRIAGAGPLVPAAAQTVAAMVAAFAMPGR